MKAMLISINPKWCELIASGKKTVEVRKTRPKLEAPFKCYIYRTLPKYGDWNDKDGKVIGEFVCDGIYYWGYTWLPDMMHIQDMSRLSCVSDDDLLKYSNGAKDKLYGWHISDLVIYDRPKELNVFYRECGGIDDTGLCYECDKAVGEECDCAVNYELHLTRPPQSWCYVEELKGKNYGN